MAKGTVLPGLPLEGKVSPEATDEVAFDEAARERTEQSFFVPKDEIVDNDYDLSINKYKQTEYVPVEYPSTDEIMKQIMELDAEATKRLVELQKMLAE